jgi:hypothetical protein
MLQPVFTIQEALCVFLTSFYPNNPDSRVSKEEFSESSPQGQSPLPNGASVP